jgi:FkbH-like protein
MKAFPELKKNLKRNFSNLISVKVALLGDTATQWLTQALEATGFDAGLDLQIWEADFNQVEQQVLDEGSELFGSDPDIIIIYHASHKLLQKYNQSEPKDYNCLADTRMKLINTLCISIRRRSDARILYLNYAEIDDAVFGNSANKTPSSFLYQLRKLNFELMAFSATHPGFHLCDLSVIQNQVGKAAMFHPALYINSEMVLSLDVLPRVAHRMVTLIGSFYGKIKKCLILDLDNTLWGGVAGDDGLENIQIGELGIGKAFTEFQRWIKKLKTRGILLAVCSKNTESVAKEPFEKHPDMVLRLEDFSVFIANWDNKMANIRRIQAMLHISFDSMVFLDDDPFERHIIREHIPSVTVPELPEDPADYLEYLYSLDLFDTGTITHEDAERTALYQTESRRTAGQQEYANLDDFLINLQMTSRVEPFNRFNTPRAAQLSQRSNQFNLRTVRYTEEDIEKMSASPGVFTFSFTLEDKFGKNGMICLVVLKKESTDSLFIDNWLMSCRVLKRGMEVFTLNTIACYAREKGFRYLKGEYRQTTKNLIVKDHYRNLGFTEDGAYWTLDLENYQTGKTYILDSNQHSGDNHGQD